MNLYPIPSPTLAGVLSDDYLYFEGTSRPQAFYALRDHDPASREVSEKNLLLLEQYFNDMYNLFLRKLTLFASGATLSSEESLKLQALLQELLKVKELIENAGKVDIMSR
jgi:hypothetical protein